MTCLPENTNPRRLYSNCPMQKTMLKSRTRHNRRSKYFAPSFNYYQQDLAESDIPQEPLHFDDDTFRSQTPAEDRDVQFMDDLDLLPRIPEMYRLLDLVLEQGSGGLGT